MAGHDLWEDKEFFTELLEKNWLSDDCGCVRRREN